MNRTIAFLLAAGFAVLAPDAPARAETTHVRFVRQLGLGYLQFHVMQEQRLVEKHAERAGLGKVTTEWLPLGSPTAITDTILTGNANVVGIGLPSFLMLWDKTRAHMVVKGIVAMNRQPAFLNTRNPAIKSLKDFTEQDRIALPAPKISVQAIMLQMLAEKTFGKYDALDRLTVPLSHPDGTTALLTGKLEVTAHFTSSPFQEQQLAAPGIHKIASSYEATGGPATFTVIAATERWRTQNPRTYKVVMDAIAEATQFIEANPREAADIFLKVEGSKLNRDFVEGLLRDPAFSFDPAPQNVMQISAFMKRVGTLKTVPASWQDLFFPEAHALPGS